MPNATSSYWRDSLHILAEIGMNHDGSFGNARALVQAAADCGATAAKMQTHIAEAETLPNAPMPPYFQNEPRFEYFKRTAFSEGQHHELIKFGRSLGIDVISSPFSMEAVELLERVGVKAIKVPSGEVTNLPMLKRIGETGLPVILSSGMSSWIELDAAINCLLKFRSHIVVLQCSSIYPCPNGSVGLNVLSELESRYKLPFGFSDHTLDNHAAFAAVALGATLIEKHFTLSKRMYGPDAAFSAEPEQFKDLARGVKAIYEMRNHPVDKDRIAVELKLMKDTFQKSIVTRLAVRKGDVLDQNKLALKKPGTGIPASEYDSILGSKAKRDLPVDHLLQPGDIEKVS